MEVQEFGKPKSRTAATATKTENAINNATENLGRTNFPGSFLWIFEAGSGMMEIGVSQK